MLRPVLSKHQCNRTGGELQGTAVANACGLQTFQVRFKDLFDSFDADRSGTLEIRELAQLVKQLVSGVTVPELKYIMVGAGPRRAMCP